MNRGSRRFLWRFGVCVGLSVMCLWFIGTIGPDVRSTEDIRFAWRHAHISVGASEEEVRDRLGPPQKICTSPGRSCARTYVYDLPSGTGGDAGFRSMKREGFAEGDLVFDRSKSGCTRRVTAPNTARGAGPGSGASLALHERVSCAARLVPRHGVGGAGRLAVPARELRSRFPLPGRFRERRRARANRLTLAGD